mmetsp:Transcript_15728/g.47534  ORF Transcript_15728/g.47534 Transcript_15728/m.47534 type:complete len:954 (+) Transcript_15728:2-2863(+)
MPTQAQAGAALGAEPGDEFAYSHHKELSLFSLSEPEPEDPEASLAGPEEVGEAQTPADSLAAPTAAATRATTAHADEGPAVSSTAANGAPTAEAALQAAEAGDDQSLGCAGSFPGARCVSPKLTVTGLSELAVEIPSLAIQGSQDAATVDDPEHNSTAVPNGMPIAAVDIGEEAFREALESTGQTIVSQVMMVIQHANCKFNVAFDFDAKHDTAIMVAKELLDAGIVTRDIPMEDLIRDIEHAIIARCQQIAAKRAEPGGMLPPEGQAHGQAGEALQPTGSVALVAPHGVVETAVPNAEAGVPAQPPGQDVAALQAQPAPPLNLDEAGILPTEPVAMQQAPRQEAALEAQLAPVLNLEEAGLEPVEAAGMQRDPSGDAAFSAIGTTATEFGDDDLPTQLPSPEYAPEGMPAQVSEAECRWVSLGWPGAHSQVLAEVFREGHVASEDSMPKEQATTLLQRSLAYLIPAVQEGDFKGGGVWCEATSKAVSSFQKYHSLSNETGVTEEKFWDMLSDEVKKRDVKENLKKAKREEEKKRSQKEREQRKQLQDRESALQLEQMMGICQMNLDQRAAQDQRASQDAALARCPSKANVAGPAVAPAPAASGSWGAVSSQGLQQPGPGQSQASMAPQQPSQQALPQHASQQQPFAGRTHTPPPHSGQPLTSSRPSSASSSRGPAAAPQQTAGPLAPAPAGHVTPRAAPPPQTGHGTAATPEPAAAAVPPAAAPGHGAHHFQGVPPAHPQGQQAGQAAVGLQPYAATPGTGGLPVPVPAAPPSGGLDGLPSTPSMSSMAMPAPAPAPTTSAVGQVSGGPATGQAAWTGAQGLPPQMSGTAVPQQGAPGPGHSEDQLLQCLQQLPVTGGSGGDHEALAAVLCGSEDGGKGQEALDAVFRSSEDGSEKSCTAACGHVAQSPTPSAAGVQHPQQPPGTSTSTGAALGTPEDLALQGQQDLPHEIH